MIVMITEIFSDIATGLGSLVPSFFKALLDGFTNLFIKTGEAGAVSLTPVGEVAIAFIVIGMVYKIMPTVIGWLKLGVSKRKSRKAKKTV